MKITGIFRNSTDKCSVRLGVDRLACRPTVQKLAYRSPAVQASLRDIVAKKEALQLLELVLGWQLKLKGGLAF